MSPVKEQTSAQIRVNEWMRAHFDSIPSWTSMILVRLAIVVGVLLGNLVFYGFDATFVLALRFGLWAAIALAYETNYTRASAKVRMYESFIVAEEMAARKQEDDLPRSTTTRSMERQRGEVL